jgi:hypothetical protein
MTEGKTMYQFKGCDAGTGSEILVILRRVSSGVALCVSREDDGDTEIVLTREDLTRLLRELEAASETFS